MEQSYVILNDVRKTYHMGEVSINAADGVNFEIKKGEFVVIVGPSGAGKTTILNILGGMDTVTSGEVIVDGVHIESFKNRQLTKYRREDIGFIFQFYNLVPNLTAKENVELALQICKTVNLTTSHHTASSLHGNEKRAVTKSGDCIACLRQILTKLSISS